MKNYIAGLFLAFGAAFSHAQTPTPTPTPLWNLIPVNNEDNRLVGHILHTYATGTRYSTPPTKSITGLRLICSLNRSADPVIALYWDNSKQGEANNVQLHIRVDNREIEQYDLWLQDDKLTYRSIKDSAGLIKAMKSGHKVQFDWFDTDATRRVTIFSLVGFGLYLNDFNTACRTQL